MDDGDPCRRIVQRVSTSRALTTRQGQQDLGSELARAGPWHRCRAGRSLAKVWSKQILGTGQPSQSLVMKGLVQASKLSAGFPEIDRINMRNITKCMNLLASHSAPPGWLLTPALAAVQQSSLLDVSCTPPHRVRGKRTSCSMLMSDCCAVLIASLHCALSQ